MAQLTPPPNGHDVARTPAVMLSPNASNRSTESLGVLFTVTVKPHPSVR